MTALLNHLWQSTAFAAVAALLALALRKNHARTRYLIWTAASLKFLIPFSLLVSMGSLVSSQFGLWRTAPAITAGPAVAIAVDEISQPFRPIDTSVNVPAPRPVMPTVLLAIWLGGCAIVLISWFRRWWRVRSALRKASPMHLEFPINAVPIKILASPALIEPGIFGIFRPVLLLPEGIADRLTPAQLQSILVHELCHVKRRDNLAALIHMLVEATFWFHPLVWWIGARLIEERERACDEEVLRSGSQPGVYAESILQVCKFYLESPLECVSGVTGSDLKKRIESIMSGLPGRSLTPARKLMLVAASLSAIGGPLIFGALNAPAIRAQNASATTRKFEVASIKPCQAPPQVPGRAYPARGNSSPGRLGTGCVPLLDANGLGLIRSAYVSFADGHLHNEFTPINGGPSWLRSAFYEINATAEGNPSVAMMMGPMMQVLLEDRFQLKVHRQTSEGPVYFLSVARGGPKLRSFTEGSCTPYSTVPPPPLQPGQEYCRSMVSAMPSAAVDEQGATLDDFSKLLLLVLDRPVINKTGITGRFDIRVDFSREGTKMGAIGPPPASDSTGPPSIFTALQEQLGLRLESGKGPVEALVIDHLEKPSDNFQPPIAAKAQTSDQHAALPAGAQSREAFDVATIKLNNAGGYGGYPGLEPGGKRFTARGLPLVALIMLAHSVTPDQISGVPSSLNTEAYDVEASCDHPIKREEALRMLQTLLADRFKLALHRETRERPIYALVVGKGGPKLRESAEELSKPDMQRTGRGVVDKSAPISVLALVLSQQLDRLVVDQTRLNGRYDFSLEFASERAGRGVLEGREPARGPDGLPSIFTALPEQLGLKLESSKAPVEILVIDHAEKPSEN